MYWSYHRVSYKGRFKLNFFLWASFTICFFLRDPSKQRRHSQMGTTKGAFHKWGTLIILLVMVIYICLKYRYLKAQLVVLRILKIAFSSLIKCYTSATNISCSFKSIKMVKCTPCTFTPYHCYTFALNELQYRPYQTCICTLLKVVNLML